MVRILLTLFIILPFGVFAQVKNRVEVIPQISKENLTKICKELELGKIIFFYEPDFPPDKQTGGTVNIAVNVDESGNIIEISKIEGNDGFYEISSKAVQKAKFSPTICDGKPVGVTAIMTYNFIFQNPIETYFFPSNVNDFTDVKNDSPFYESISNLTDNYKISFGFPDSKFHEKTPLTRGDFAEFLRLTLDLLFKRAGESNKIPLEIGLVKQFNPQNITSAKNIKDLKIKSPFANSVSVLLQTYNIALVDKDLNFNGNTPMTRNEVIELWRQIFGREAVPVNFEISVNNDQKFTRGEFALFLNESMQVLSYKVLP